MRTRMSGGVTGKAGDSLPMFIGHTGRLHNRMGTARRSASLNLGMAEPEETPPDLTVDIELVDKAFGEMRDLGNWLLDAERQNEWFGPLLFHLIRSTLR